MTQPQNAANGQQEAAELLALLESMSEPIWLELEPVEAAGVLSNLHLALRHPANQGRGAELTRAVAWRLIVALEQQNPAISRHVRPGWGEEF